jgi:hypothetical protein
VVYRLRRVGDETASWHRVRVVVSRKGIRRIDHIGEAGNDEVGSDVSLAG